MKVEMYAKRSNQYRVQGRMDSLSASNVQPQKHNGDSGIAPSLNPPVPPSPVLDLASSATLTPASCAVTIDRSTDAVDKLELELSKRKCREQELAHQAKQNKEGRALTDKEDADVTRTVDATEFAARKEARSVTITHAAGDTESVAVLELPNSYQQIKNLVWIESQPVYKTALADWTTKVETYEARVERMITRSAALTNEIYNLIGFYSVFQGVLLTSTSQSSYLHCQNVGVVISLSTLASACCVFSFSQKFKHIGALEKTICTKETFLKEARKRIASLRSNGEAFRFFDFPEDKETTSSHCTGQKLTLCGLQTWWLVPLILIIFSVLFALAHPLILCRPALSITTMKTKFVNGTDNVLTLKEGNSGIHKLVYRLGRSGDTNSTFEMSLDSNATYKEYHFATIPASSRAIMVSPDDLADHKVITITEPAPGVFSWEGVLRNPRPDSTRSSSSPAFITRTLTLAGKCVIM